MKMDQQTVKTVLMIAILSVSISYIVATGLKSLFAVPRPCELMESCPDSFSFPSRHTTMAFAGAVALSLYFRRLKYTAVLFLLAAAVGYWRLSIGVHTVTDIVGGAVIGLAIGAAMYYFVKKFHGSMRRRRR